MERPLRRRAARDDVPLNVMTPRKGDSFHDACLESVWL